MMRRSRATGPEWMVTYTPQEEWIEGKGKFLWLAFFFSEIGAGIYFVSLFMNFPTGWLVGWL
ncbi:MAG: nitrite reductase, partial [Pseudomonadota bacterium]